jgi:co-chaperonin GroES (HSP10)
MTVQVYPTGNRLYVRRGGSATQSAADLILVEDRPQIEIGTVEAVGPGEWQSGGRVPVGVSPGARVLFDRYAGSDHGEDHVFLSPSEVLAVLPD